MKKNLGLLLVFSVLFYVTYQIEEVGDQKKKKEVKKESQVFNFSKLGKIKELKTPKSHLVWKDNKVYVKGSGILVSKHNLNLLLDILGNIAIKRHLNKSSLQVGVLENEKDFLGDHPLKFTFTFERGEAHFTLGKKLSYSQDFYMLVENSTGERQLIIATDKTPLEGVYQKEGFENNDRKYQRLLSLLYLENSFFYERLVFSNLFGKKKLAHIEFSSFRNPSFSVDIQNEKTSPNAPEGIEVDRNKINLLLDELGKLKADNVYKMNEKIFPTKKRAKISFNLLNNKVITFDIFSNYNGKVGTFLKRSGQVFEINKNDSPILFSNLQEFWTKKLSIIGPLKNITFRPKNKRPLKFKVNSKTLETGPAVKAIMNYFTREADKVSNIDLDLKRLLFSKDNKNTLKFLIDGIEFAMVFSDNETRVVDTKKNLVLHYFGNDKFLLDNFLKKHKEK